MPKIFRKALDALSDRQSALSARYTPQWPTLLPKVAEATRAALRQGTVPRRPSKAHLEIRTYMCDMQR